VESLPPGILRQIVAATEIMFELADPVDYELDAAASIGARAAARGEDAAGAVYDARLRDEGRQLLYLPVFNFAHGDLEDVHDMITSPNTIFGLSDAGAHCGAICDASMTTSYLTVWARDRSGPAGVPLEAVVHQITRRTAEHVGWLDRGLLAPGHRADLNLIDLDALGCAPPRIVHDLPAGGRRLFQDATGYRMTIKSGIPTFVEGVHTGELPGGLVRGATASPA
jgi:N-acyl-D-aspartate/D-glutamate deacylase